MKLSIIIVSYNVRYFLEQCLHSVITAGKNLPMEVFVVDNASVDGSVKMVKEKFPTVHCIANADNVGFSKANNQAIRLATGEYILLLNPDTVIETDTFTRICGFMDAHPDAGGLGVKMVDGTGRFLPESKRGLPTPGVAFAKIFGLSKLFPHSRTFNRYHLGHLDKEKTHQVDVLSGAFMLVRKTALDKTGLLDEAFFMYGEDIDLSYRITQAGYKNYYFPETRIIHYKGESTRKGSLNYVFIFYNAMIIFAKKHFSKQNARLFSFLINLAVYFRAFLSVIHRLVLNVLSPLLDFLLIYSGMLLLARYWEHAVKYPYGGHYPNELYLLVLPVYILIWLKAIYLSGGYDKPVRPMKSALGIALGTVFILIIYALLPESMRYSRLLTLLGSVWAIAATLIVRYGLHLAGNPNFRIRKSANLRFLIAGCHDEATRVEAILRKAMPEAGFIGLVNAAGESSDPNGFIGPVHRLKDIIAIYAIDEVIFCAKDIPAEDIIDHMSELQGSEVSFKIAPPESLSIIGSNSINTAGDLYVIDINAINTPMNRRIKRIFDLIASVFLFVSLPVLVFLVPQPHIFLLNLLKVLAGLRTWTGYHPMPVHEHKLPMIKPSVLYATDVISGNVPEEDTIHRMNLLYARNYNLTNEIRILFAGIRRLGRK